MKLHRSHTRLAALAGAAALFLFLGLAQPVASASAPRVSLSGPSLITATTGRVTLRTTVHGATLCKFSSSPTVGGFNGAVPCKTGTVIRTGTVGINTGASRSFTLTVRVTIGGRAKAYKWYVVQLGASGVTTTTRPTTTTTGTPGSLQFAFLPGTDVNANVGSSVYWSLCKPAPATGGLCGGLDSPTNPTTNPSGGGGGPYTFSLEIATGLSSLPPGVVLNPNGTITGTVLTGDDKIQYSDTLPLGVDAFGVCITTTTASKCFGTVHFTILPAAPTTTTTTRPTTTSSKTIWYDHWSCEGMSACVQTDEPGHGINDFTGPNAESTCEFEATTFAGDTPGAVAWCDTDSNPNEPDPA